MAIAVPNQNPTEKKPAAVPPDRVWRLSVDEYHRMIETGVLEDDAPVELLDGWLIEKMSKNPRHRLINRLLRQAIEQHLPAGWYADSQEPITLSMSEPEPDVTVIRGAPLDYSHRHPSAVDLGLVVEVADSSLERDRTWKQRLYAEAGIPIYWLVDLVHNRIEVFSQPDPAGYQNHQAFLPGTELPFGLDGRLLASLPVSDFLA